MKTIYIGLLGKGMKEIKSIERQKLIPSDFKVKSFFEITNRKRITFPIMQETAELHGIGYFESKRKNIKPFHISKINNPNTAVYAIDYPELPEDNLSIIFTK